MSDTYEMIGIAIVGIVVLGIAGAAVSFGYTNNLSESGNNAGGIQSNEPSENIFRDRSDARNAVYDTESEKDDSEKNPEMEFEEFDEDKIGGGSRKKKQTKRTKYKKHRKSHKKTQKKHKKHKR